MLKRGAQTLAETTSDPYGDFKFAGLDEGSGRYQLEIADERFAPKAVAVELVRSTYLGTIPLAPRAAVPA